MIFSSFSLAFSKYKSLGILLRAGGGNFKVVEEAVYETLVPCTPDEHDEVDSRKRVPQHDQLRGNSVEAIRN